MKHTAEKGRKVFLITNMVITFIMLVVSVLTGRPLQQPLLISLILFIIYAKYTGFAWKEIWNSAWKGAKKSMVVVEVMLIIGLLTASWFLSGTIPWLVNLGIRIITPKLFLLCAFLICAAVSVTIGTSFGTVNTVGVVLMVIARGSDVNLALTAGAILSGIYVGDRCSPMASSLLLLSTMTKTDHYENVKMCIRTSIVPVGVCIVLYGILSQFHPMLGSSGNMAADIEKSFVMRVWLVIPILIIFVMCLKKISIKITMLCSIGAAVLFALAIQKVQIGRLIYCLLFGFSLPEGVPSAAIMKGGGLFGMISTCFVILFSCMITEILEATHSLDIFMGKKEETNPFTRYLKSLVTGFASAAIGCNQTVGIIMTSMLREKAYGERRDLLARDMSVAGQIVPGLVPWCIAIYTPVQILGYEGLGYYPFMFLLLFFLVWGGAGIMINTKRGE